MTYKINGIALLVQPTEGIPVERRVLGVDGNNLPIYVPVYSFQLSFDGLTPAQYKQLRDFWLAVSASGSVSADLPQLDAATYVFKTYTGVVPSEPRTRAYFQEHLLRVEWLLRNIVL